MKSLLALLFALSVSAFAETPEELVKEAIKSSAFYDNGFDRSPEGQRKTMLNNSKFGLALFMGSDEVPAYIRTAYALEVMKSQLATSWMKGSLNPEKMEIDEVKTAEMRTEIARKISILEDYYVTLFRATTGVIEK
jgi:hypothetical protein